MVVFCHFGVQIQNNRKHSVLFVLGGGVSITFYVYSYLKVSLEIKKTNKYLLA